MTVQVRIVNILLHMGGYVRYQYGMVFTSLFGCQKQEKGERMGLGLAAGKSEKKKSSQKLYPAGELITKRRYPRSFD